jgi:chromosome segregation ATPase
MMPLIGEIGFPELGGSVGILAAVVYAIRELRTWLHERKTVEIAEDSQHVSATSAAVADAATTNSILLRSYEALLADNQRKDIKIDHLETRNSEKDNKIENLQKEVRSLRAQVHILLQRLDGVDFELDDLRDKP